jgi:hypothetical protein
VKTNLLLSAIIPVVLWLAFGQEKRTPLILSVERATHGTIYRLNSKNVTTAPLNVLAEAMRSRGQDYPIVEVDDRLSINTLDNARGLIQKAGFTNSEYYVFNADTQKKWRKLPLEKLFRF